jgi:hypothetical protein
LVVLRSLADSERIGHSTAGRFIWLGGCVRRLALALAVLVQSGALASANDARIEKVLKQLDPDARFEQVCDLEAMKLIGKDKTYRPERSMVGALEPPKVVDSTMTGSGGAFKSKGQWYQFSFRCQTTPDHMKVQAFTFHIGEPIPQDKWEASGLW